ncbi:hypothetical protein GWE18_15760 [Bradyrhizobium sp. CSA112]|uniref:hypothetical protein n=1 Tax=Bradyrhizobium sp. CSA112 TaxID=2699170 RepID=UPI0023B10C14|nr:hypothetical protein [Bradyrhizobium sp. CSA112]MDE5454266.1 hypothetical protein [Bradyrhizobium sp. CSA112]
MTQLSHLRTFDWQRPNWKGALARSSLPLQSDVECTSSRKGGHDENRLSTLIVALSLSTSAGFAQQPAQCRNFEATIALQMTKEGCLSQIDLCIVGTVMSSEPALSGATWFFTAHGMAETAGLPSLPKALQSYAGTVVVTARAGTFTTTTAGMYDTESQAFSQLDRSSRKPIDSATPLAGSFFSPASVGKVADLTRTLAASCA